MATKKEDNKVFDVAKPGTSKPQTGSKPMVVGHNAPTVNDPTLKEEIDKAAASALETKEEKAETINDESSAGSNDTENKKPAAKKIIKPLSEEEKADETIASDDTTAETESSNKDTEPQDNVSVSVDKSKEDGESDSEKLDSPDSVETPIETNITEQPEESSPDLDTSVEEEKLTDEEKKKKKEKDAGDVQLERENKLNEMIKSKKYVLPIKQSRNSPATQFFIILITSLLIGLAILVALIDAEIISTNLELPFDLL